MWVSLISGESGSSESGISESGISGEFGAGTGAPGLTGSGARMSGSIESRSKGMGTEVCERGWIAADLHLDGGETSRDGLDRLLRAVRADGAPLFLLGDVFHYWFGPRHLRLPMYRREIHLLRAATALGTPITIVPGNRDFLLDASFTRETGVRIVPDAWEIRVDGERVHLTHGDLFGSADVRYQRMRRVLHSAPVRGLARSLPTAVVNAIARRLRRHSEVVVARKDETTLAPDRSAVAALFRDGVSVVVCGHFHHEVDERFPPEEGGGRFRVLEPYEERGAALRFAPEGWSTERLGVGDAG